MDVSTLFLAFLLFLIALLYSAVGHGGASGYLAVMALFNVPTTTMRPTALILNIIVSAISSYKYLKEKRFSLNTFIVFAFLSVPGSYIGGAVQLPNHQMKIVIGILLILSSFAMIVRTFLRSDYSIKEVPEPVGLVCGGIIGFFSGLTSIGGGIFLSPLLIFFKWSSVRNASGIAALFILVNSIAGFWGQLSKGIDVSMNILPFAVAVTLGGYAGSELGSKKLNNCIIMIFLFAVLIVAAIKMFMA
jgi:uncharacterized membrane protein YfcA